MATGFVPCPLTTFILKYALAQNRLAVGLAAVIAMLGGVIATLVSFAVGAVFARARFMAAMRVSEGTRQKLGYWLELAGAAAVLLLGLVLLWNAVGRL